MMRLRALRLAEFKRFNAPVALEGIGDGLNVLTAPNEFGKSTLFDALDAALRISYKATGKQVDALQSNSGGAPRLEVDFEADNRLWRLQKQFLSGRSASLLDLTSGALLRNAEAEARLAALKSGAFNFDRFGLLWVKQRDFEAPTDGDGSVTALVATEVDAVALDAQARAVLARIRKELSELQTDKARADGSRRPKTKGAWALCLDAHENAAARLAQAETEATRQADRLAELARLVDEREKVTAPQAVASRTEALKDGIRRHDEALAARRQKLETEKELKAAQEAVRAAEREQERIAADLAALAQLQQESEAARGYGAELSARGENAANVLKIAEASAHEQHARLAELETAVASLTAALRAHEAAAERDKVASQIAAVRSVMADAETARQTVTALATVTPENVKSLEDALRGLEKIEAEFSAVVPEVTIALESSALGRVTVGGRPIAADSIYNPAEPLTIEIAGVGRITVAPNPATVSSTQRAKRIALRGQIETLYAALGVATLADAQARLTEKQDAESKKREADIKLHVLAPMGIDTLLALHNDFDRRAASAIPNFDPSAVETRRCEFDKQRLVVAEKDAIVAKTRQVASEVAIDQAKHGEAERARAQQLQVLERRLGGTDERQRVAADIERTLAIARKSFADARIAVDALATAPDAAEVEALGKAMTKAQRAVKAAEDHRAALDVRIGGIEGELRAASDVDIESELEKARAHAAMTTTRLAEIDVEVRALNLLEREIQSIADTGRRELSGPIIKRISPYLTRLFPDATLELNSVLGPVRITRNGREESHSQLSEGTKEQVAILVRLGLAQLLADKGAAVPLLLDDALVYSDDQRIAAMFEMLKDAAQRHQVIVLNCREQTFAPLAAATGATVLSLKPWVHSAIAA